MTSQSSTKGQTIVFLQRKTNLDFKAGYIICTMPQTKKLLEHSVWHYRKKQLQNSDLWNTGKKLNMHKNNLS